MGMVVLFLGLPTLDGSPGPGAESCPPTPPPCPVCRPLNATLMAGGRPGLIAKLRPECMARTFPRLHGYLKSECNSLSRGVLATGNKDAALATSSMGRKFHLHSQGNLSKVTQMTCGSVHPAVKWG